MRRSRLRRVLLGGAVAGVAGLAFGAPTAGAQAAPQLYGGGLFGELDAKGYQPTVGVTLDQRPTELAIRFDTTLRCGRDTYQVSAGKVVPSSGQHAEATGHSSFRLGRGRVRFSWKISVDLSPTAANGVLRIGGRRRGRESCTHKPTRRFQALPPKTVSGSAATPPAGALYLGLSENRESGMPLPVLVRVATDGKWMGARWSASADCRRGEPEPLINFTPATAVRPDGSFSRSEHFKQVFADTVVRYRALFRGHFTSEGAVGALRLRVRVYGRKGKRLLTRCDTGLQPWKARGPAA